MPYTKLTARRWVRSLKEKGYKSASAAKKGIGRIDWPKEAKDVARNIIDAHFEGKVISEADIKALERLVPAEAAPEPVKRAPSTKVKDKPVDKPNGKKRTPVAGVGVPLPIDNEVKELLELRTAVEIGKSLSETQAELYELLCSIEENGGDGSYKEQIAERLPQLVTALDRVTRCYLKYSERFDVIEEKLPGGATEKDKAVFDKTKPKDPFKPSEAN